VTRVLKDLINGKDVKKHSHVLICMWVCFFANSCTKYDQLWWKHLHTPKIWKTPNES